MAKINHVSAQPQYFKVRIDVDDPDCVFSISPKISYHKVFKAYSPNTAIRTAANYCNKYMKYYPGVEFKYSTKEVEPYYYPIKIETTPEDSTGVKKIKI